MSDFRVVFGASFARDMARLEEFIQARESSSEFPDDTAPVRFQATVARGLGILSFAPHTCRRCEAAPQWRELVVPFGQTGCIILFEIRDDEVWLLAARAQREEDYR